MVWVCADFGCYELRRFTNYLSGPCIIKLPHLVKKIRKWLHAKRDFWKNRCNFIEIKNCSEDPQIIRLFEIMHETNNATTHKILVKMTWTDRYEWIDLDNSVDCSRILLNHHGTHHSQDVPEKLQLFHAIHSAQTQLESKSKSKDFSKVVCTQFSPHDYITLVSLGDKFNSETQLKTTQRGIVDIISPVEWIMPANETESETVCCTTFVTPLRANIFLSVPYVAIFLQKIVYYYHWKFWTFSVAVGKSVLRCAENVNFFRENAWCECTLATRNFTFETHFWQASIVFFIEAATFPRFFVGCFQA